MGDDLAQLVGKINKAQDAGSSLKLLNVLVAEQHDQWRNVLQRTIEGTFGKGTVTAVSTYPDFDALRETPFQAYVVSGTMFDVDRSMLQTLGNGRPVYVVSALDVTVREAQRLGYRAYDKTAGDFPGSLIAQMRSDLKLDH